MSTALDIVIIGGSISGLMCGVVLKHAGHNVTIYEQDHDERESHMAGVCLGRDAEELLARHDRIKNKFWLDCDEGVQVFRSPGKAAMYVPGRRLITSWDALYYRLRANFDGYLSKFCPTAGSSLPTDGDAQYLARTRVLDISRDSSSNKMLITTSTIDTNQTTTRTADFIIGADGPNSLIRAKYLPTSQRTYSGNIAWRGIVPERELSPETIAQFNRNVTVSLMPQHHCLAYMIPGPNGSLTPGTRSLNFLWYTNEHPSTLPTTMADAHTGHQHHNIVPAGHIRTDIWIARLQHAAHIPLARPFLETIQKIPRPFIQAITSFCAPRVAFEDGRVLLVGDAACLFRPHTAFSGTQAAFHALHVEDYISGRITVEQWHEKCHAFSRLYWAQSEWWGRFYQETLVSALPALARYWWWCAVDWLVAWWRGDEPLLARYGRGVVRMAMKEDGNGDGLGGEKLDPYKD